MPEQNSDLVRCQTTKGEVDIKLVPEWSPVGVFRFKELVEAGYFRKMPLFRCVSDFLCQFGYKETPVGEHEWSTIADDKPGPDTPREFRKGYVSFAGNGANSRSSHLFVTLGDNVSSLGKELWETPIGYVVESSLPVVDSWYTKYGDMPPWGPGPDPGRIATVGGYKYLANSFPKLDYITRCEIVSGGRSEKLKEDVRPKVVFDLAPKLGRVVVELNRDWGTKGVDRLIEMINAKFLDQARFFRVVPGFVVQFGMPADPSQSKEFPTLPDEPVKGSNIRGTITFATSGPNTRTTQLFINLGNNQRLDDMGFSPIGKVIEGMEFIDRINSEYLEQPDQGQISRFGNEYLNKNFPRLSYIQTARSGDISIITADEDVLHLRNNDLASTNSSGHVLLFVAIFAALLCVYVFISKRIMTRAMDKAS